MSPVSEQRNVVVGLLVVAFCTAQASAALENLSRGKNVTQSPGRTYGNSSASYANDGDYDNTDVSRCASVFLSSRSDVYWRIDLGGLYAIISVTAYSAAVPPDSAFLVYTYVYLLGNGDIHVMSKLVHVPPAGNLTITFNAIRVARHVKFERRSALTLCEVDVVGTKVDWSYQKESISRGKPTNQSGTQLVRKASYAVDGNYNTTHLDSCATAVYDGSYTWWQVDLQDFYLVTGLTIHAPDTSRERYFLRRAGVYVSHASNYLTGVNCYQFSSTFIAVDSTVTVNCTSLLTVGRYVTIRKRISSSYGLSSVVTLCEVDVYGIKQLFSSTDPALAVLYPDNDVPAESETDTDNVTRPLAIAAMAVAGVALILGVVLLVLFIIQCVAKRDTAGKKSRQAATPKNVYDNETSPADRPSSERVYDDIQDSAIRRPNRN